MIYKYFTILCSQSKLHDFHVVIPFSTYTTCGKTTKTRKKKYAIQSQHSFDLHRTLFAVQLYNLAFLWKLVVCVCTRFFFSSFSLWLLWTHHDHIRFARYRIKIVLRCARNCHGIHLNQHKSIPKCLAALAVSVSNAWINNSRMHQSRSGHSNENHHLFFLLKHKNHWILCCKPKTTTTSFPSSSLVYTPHFCVFQLANAMHLDCVNVQCTLGFVCVCVLVVHIREFGSRYQDFLIHASQSDKNVS